MSVLIGRAVFCGGCLLLPCASASAAPGSRVVAEVDSVPIYAEDVEKERGEQLPDTSEYSSGSTMNSVDRIILHRLIERQLLWQEAQDEKLVPSHSEVSAVLDEAKTAAGGKEGFSERLKEAGITETEFRSGVEIDLSIKKLLEQKVYARIAIAEQDLVSEYHNRKNNLVTPEEIHARDIFFRVNGENDSEARRTEAERVRAEAIKDPKQFASLAKKYSDGPARGKGGDLGFFSRNQMPAVFSERAFSLSEGAISDVFRLPEGFHIVMVEERRGGELPAFETVRRELESRLLQERRAQALADYLDELRRSSKIIVYSQ